MSVIGIITARSGSKGFPHKNIARLGGRSLVELSTIQGRDSKLIDDVYISTDSQAYADQAMAQGALFEGLRPEALSGDTVKTVDVLIDLLGKLEKQYDYTVLLQPTAPMRTPEDLDNVIRLMQESDDVDAVLAVERLEEPHPAKVKRVSALGYLEPYIPGTESQVPRQSLPLAYNSNGAIYACKTSILLAQRTMLPERTRPYIMGKSVNVDCEEDYLLMKMMHEMGRFDIYGAENYTRKVG